MSTYAEFATSRPVIGELVERLQLAEVPNIQVELIVGTELMEVTAEALDPIIARDAANALAEILVEQSRSLYLGSGKSAQEILGEQLAQQQAELDKAWEEYEKVVAEYPEDAERISGASLTIELKENTYAQLLDQYERNRVREAVLANTLSVVEPAVAPRRPARPRSMLNLALGVVVGLAGGMGLAFFIESLDTTLHSTEQIKRVVDLPILGKVPSASKKEEAGLFNGSSPQGEAFRRLRTSLLTLDRDSSLHTLLVTSAEPREGKSTVVANLGFAMAQSGRKVIVVDGHLRLPTLHRILKLGNRVGLSTVLEKKTPLDEAIQPAGVPGVDALTSGPLPPNPAELLSSPEMTNLIEQLGQLYDLVLLDSPSLMAVTDAAAVARSLDGVVLVIECARARQESVRAAWQQLADVKASPVGVVVNRTKQDDDYSYYQRIPD
jgi:non-specific protein-tyrosine kinase